MSPNRRSCRGGGPGGGPVLADGTHGINEVAAHGPTVSALAAVALGALVGAAWVRRQRHSADPPAAPPPAASPPAAHPQRPHPRAAGADPADVAYSVAEPELCRC